ncbi:WD40 repeat domain-containing protein [Kovacikia minuta CCNUW1]|uniref:WD40 repeat domain-containing protein n=1 Tax=Kovacikia minuta TaxID=2931930 RepID=UPI001CCD62DA|nr:WD40 repeat domain-containing protein [Kovacikia minuta]UBF29096.1 WD40 repeat domain-containing protein [Kovacikia minuta CCNUW1]
MIKLTNMGINGRAKSWGAKRMQESLLGLLVISATLFNCSCSSVISHFSSLPEPKTLQLQLSNSMAGISDVAISPDGNSLAIINYSNPFIVWDRRSGHILFSLPLTSQNSSVTAVAFSPDKNALLTGDFSQPNKQLTLWNAQTGKLEKKLASQGSYITTIAFSPDGKIVASGGRDDNAIRVWNLYTGQLKYVFIMPRRIVQIGFSSDSNFVRGADLAGTVHTYDIKTGKLIQTLADSKNEIGVEDVFSKVAFASNGKLMARGDANKGISLWNLETGNRIRIFSGHFYDSAHALAFSPNSKILATVGYSGRRELATGMRYHDLRLWDVQTGRLLGQSDKERHIMALAFTPDGKELITGSYPGQLLIWDISEIANHL